MSILGRHERGDLQLPMGAGFCPEKVSARAAKVARALDAASSAAEGAAAHAAAASLSVRAVEWQWLYGFGSGCRFLLDEADRVVAVRGKNASGKSAFADVVMLGLFGKETDARESRQQPASVVCRGKPDDAVAWTEVVVDVQGSRFRVRREFVAKAGGRLAQTAMVTMDGSGAVLHTGRAAVDAWVSEFVDLKDFLLIDRRDRDLLSIRSSDQKALMDAAMRTSQVQAELDAVDESRRAHKWLGDGMVAAAEAGASSPDDPADGALADAMCAAKDAAVRTAVIKAQLVFAESAREAAREKRDIARRVAELGRVEPRPVPADEMRRLRDAAAAAEDESRAAESALRAVERAAVPAPRRPDGQDSVEYLEEKAAKYRRAKEVRTRLESLGQPCAFNDGCWACVEREGANVSARADCQNELFELGVAGTLEDISKKCRGYERRLQGAAAAAEAEEGHRAWSESHERAVALARRKREAAAAALLAAETARLQDDTHRFGARVCPGDMDSGLAERLAGKLADARRAEADRRVRASELRALRRAANSQRVRSGALERAGRECLEKARALRDSHEEAARAFDERYCDAVERLAEKANEVLEAAYGGLGLRAEWSSRSSFVFWMSNARGVTLPVEKASGFERSAASVAVKAALKALGYGSSCGWMMIDEATAGYDESNAARLPALLGAAAETAGGAVIALTHQTIEGVRTADIEESAPGLALLRFP